MEAWTSRQGRDMWRVRGWCHICHAREDHLVVHAFVEADTYDDPESGHAEPSSLARYATAVARAHRCWQPRAASARTRT